MVKLEVYALVGYMAFFGKRESIICKTDKAPTVRPGLLSISLREFRMFNGKINIWSLSVILGYSEQIV